MIPMLTEWKNKIWAERVKRDGIPLQYETQKAMSKMRGILEYRRTVLNYLEKNGPEIIRHINPTVIHARKEMIEKFIEILKTIEPEKPKIQNQVTSAYPIDMIKEGNRKLLQFQGLLWDNKPMNGWYNDKGEMIWASINIVDYHINMKRMGDLAMDIRAEIILNGWEDQFDDNLVLERRYEFLNVYDLWKDSVQAAVRIFELRKEKVVQPDLMM